MPAACPPSDPGGIVIGHLIKISCDTIYQWIVLLPPDFLADEGAPAKRRWMILISFIGLSLIAVLPIGLVGLPPILDYPNHMARMHILSAISSSPLSSADLSRYYLIHWTPLPDLAADAIVPILALVMGVENAMRLFLALILIGIASGCLALHRVAFQKWSLWPLSVFLLLYNRMLLWGFINYLAGLALSLWGLTAWIALERKSFGLRVAIGAVFATAIYLAHLAAFGCYALVIVAFSLAPRDGETFSFRRALPAIISVMPPAALFLMSPTSAAPSSIAYGNILRKFDLPVSIFDNYNRIFDGATFAILSIAVTCGLARHALVAHRRLRWSILTLSAAFILMPSQFLSASGIDHRMPIAIALIGIAAIDWSGMQPPTRRMVGIGLFLLFLVRMAVVDTVWLQADSDYDALLPVFDLIPKGAPLAVATPPRAVQAGGVPLLHFPAMAAVRRDAFVPSLFADPLQQPMRFTQRAAMLAAEIPPARLWQAIATGSMPQLPGYDDLMIIDPPAGLDLAALPGRILFKAPRLILIELKQGVRLPAQ